MQVMAQNIYMITDDNTSYIAKEISCQIFINKKIISPGLELTENILSCIAKECLTEDFYIIFTHRNVDVNTFDFSYKIPLWDKKYVHIWNNDFSIRLFNKDAVIKNVKKYTDRALMSNELELKNMYGLDLTYLPFEIVHLSYDESYAESSYKKLSEKFPKARRITGIKGIFEAHRAAAQLAADNNSSMFYVVDADADILPSFYFNYKPDFFQRNTVHVWKSKNPINDLEYGYGGIKLFPTHLVLNYKGNPVDFSTSVSDKFCVMDEISNITKFNSDSFSTWRSAFRECAKLASFTIHNQNSYETQNRLDIWCTKGKDREFGEYAINGAQAGKKFGTENAKDYTRLSLINDYGWLRNQFDQIY